VLRQQGPDAAPAPGHRWINKPQEPEEPEDEGQKKSRKVVSKGLTSSGPRDLLKVRGHRTDSKNMLAKLPLWVHQPGQLQAVTWERQINT
jgi:hypothetical protein